MNYIILGSISAAVTTPLDVAKTRIMLANRTLLPSELTISTVLYKIYIENNVYGYISS
jgi:lipoprotein NlpI